MDSRIYSGVFIFLLSRNLGSVTEGEKHRRCGFQHWISCQCHLF